MSASDRVFDIPELCEAILLYLPPTDLLISAQRVAKSWRALIAGSCRLQRKLFFKQHSDYNRDVVPIANPFYKKICRDISEWYVYEYSADFVGGEQIRKKLAIPHFVAYFDLDKPMDGKALDGKPSWLRMWITNRPCGVQIVVGGYRTVYDEWDAVSVKMEEMMTMVVEECSRGSADDRAKG